MKQQFKMNSSQRILFTPFRLGPVILRNRAIRAAAFEGMCPGRGAVMYTHQAVCIKNIKNPDPRILKMLQ